MKSTVLSKSSGLIPDRCFIRRFYGGEIGAPYIYVGIMDNQDGCKDGEWINMCKVDDFEEFEEIVAVIAGSKNNPLIRYEYMHIPDEFQHKFEFTEEDFLDLKDWIEEDYCEEESAFEVYQSLFPDKDYFYFTIDYIGRFKSKEDFFNKQCANVESELGALAAFFNRKAYIENIFKMDYIFEEGFVFKRS